jgi:hypothetical protein
MPPPRRHRLPSSPPTPAAYDAGTHWRSCALVCSTGSPSAPLRSDPECDEAANPSRRVRLGRRRGSSTTAPPAAPLSSTPRAPPRRPVLLLLRLFCVRLGVTARWRRPVAVLLLLPLSPPLQGSAPSTVSVSQQALPPLSHLSLVNFEWYYSLPTMCL